MVHNSGSVSRWIQCLKNGDQSAAARLWSRYSTDLAGVARNALGGASRSVADEDDVVTQAFFAFTRRTSGGAYPAVETRSNLWRLLVVVTRTYAWKQARFFDRLKRGGKLGRKRFFDVDKVLSAMANRTASPETTVAIGDTLAMLLSEFDDDEMSRIVIGRLEGKSHEEIATELNRSVRTIERRLKLVRELWSRELVS